MKKKTVYALIALLAVSFMSVPLTSCSDDDDDLTDIIKPDPSNPAITGDHDPDVVGTWECTYEGSDWGKKITINYRSDGRYYETEEYWEEEDGKTVYDDPYWESGYWATEKTHDDNYIYVYCTNSCDEDEVGDSGSNWYYIEDGSLYISGDEYTRK